MSYPPEFKVLRLRRGKLIHVSEVSSLRVTGCGRSADGAIYSADEAPTCKKCLRAMLDALN